MTGHRLKSRELLKYGIATHFVPSSNLEGLYQDLKSKVKNESDINQITEIVNSHADHSHDQDPIPHLDEINHIF